jgi:hypothetical protein
VEICGWSPRYKECECHNCKTKSTYQHTDLRFQDEPSRVPGGFLAARVYDFNAWSWKRRIEKLNYLLRKAVKRGL